MVPLLNEEQVLPLLWDKLKTASEEISGVRCEFIFVDDGSEDATWELLATLAAEHAGIRCLRLSRNFGQQNAFLAGLAESRGDAVVFMDGDLQDEPWLLSRLLEEHRNGHQVVNVRRGQRDSPLWLRSAYHLFYRFLRWSSSHELPFDTGDFSLVSRQVADEILRCTEQRPYLRGLRAWVGFSQTSIEADRPARAAGRSKYSLSKLLQLASDALFSFSLLPIRLMLFLGAVAVASSVAFGMYAVLWKLLWGDSPSGFTALLVVMVFLGGVNFFIVGLLGEYVGRILEEVRGRPRFIVAERALLGESEREQQ